MSAKRQLTLRAVLGTVAFFAIVFALWPREDLKVRLKEELSLSRSSKIEFLHREGDIAILLVKDIREYRLLGAYRAAGANQSDPRWYLSGGFGANPNHPSIRYRTGPLFSYFLDAGYSQRPSSQQVEEFAEFANSAFTPFQYLPIETDKLREAFEDYERNAARGTFDRIPTVAKPSSPTESLSWVLASDRRYELRNNSTGTRIRTPRYDDARPFSEGLSAVNAGAEWKFPGIPMGGKWGYVDTRGQLVIPIQYEIAGCFSDGLANVKTGEPGGGTLYIDRSGKVQLQIPEGYAGDFSEGLAPVYKDRSLEGLGWQTRYINKRGETVFTIDGFGEEYHEGFAVFSVRSAPSSNQEGSAYGFIDKQGAIVVDPVFGLALPFCEGLAAVQTARSNPYGSANAWGYIDRSGEMVIPPSFNDAISFENGHALVHDGGEYVLVEDAPCYWEGGTWWLIDKRGTKIGRIEE